MLVNEELFVQHDTSSCRRALWCSRISMCSAASRGTVQRERVADLGWHGIANAFLLAVLDITGASSGSPRAILTVTPTASLVSKDAEDACIFGEKQGAVSKDVDLLSGGFEEPRPYLVGNGPPMRVDGSEFFRSASAP